MKKLLPLLTEHPGMPPQRFGRRGNELQVFPNSKNRGGRLNVKCPRRDLISTHHFFLSDLDASAASTPLPGDVNLIPRKWVRTTASHFMKSHHQDDWLGWLKGERIRGRCSFHHRGSRQGGNVVTASYMCPRGCSCWIRHISPAGTQLTQTHSSVSDSTSVSKCYDLHVEVALAVTSTAPMNHRRRNQEARINKLELKVWP